VAGVSTATVFKVIRRYSVVDLDAPERVPATGHAATG